MLSHYESNLKTKQADVSACRKKLEKMLEKQCHLLHIKGGSWVSDRFLVLGDLEINSKHQNHISNFCFKLLQEKLGLSKHSLVNINFFDFLLIIL